MHCHVGVYLIVFYLSKLTLIGISAYISDKLQCLYMLVRCNLCTFNSFRFKYFPTSKSTQIQCYWIIGIYCYTIIVLGVKYKIWRRPTIKTIRSKLFVRTLCNEYIFSTLYTLNSRLFKLKKCLPAPELQLLKLLQHFSRSSRSSDIAPFLYNVFTHDIPKTYFTY